MCGRAHRADHSEVGISNRIIRVSVTRNVENIKKVSAETNHLLVSSVEIRTSLQQTVQKTCSFAETTEEIQVVSRLVKTSSAQFALLQASVRPQL